LLVGVVCWLSTYEKEVVMSLDIDERGGLGSPSKAPRLVGCTIKMVRPMTEQEIWFFGWDEYKGMEGDAVVVELDDGSLLVPSRDAELNGGGHLVRAVPREDDNTQTLDLLGMFIK